jgi:hypothetical protein
MSVEGAVKAGPDHIKKYQKKTSPDIKCLVGYLSKNVRLHNIPLCFNSTDEPTKISEVWGLFIPGGEIALSF